MYESQLAALSTLKKLSSYEDGYNLYEISMRYEYDLDALTGDVARVDQAYMDAVAAQIFPGSSFAVPAPNFGCSAFGMRTDSAVLTGRNYDFKQDTSALLVRNNPLVGYASIGFACLNNLGANKPGESLKTKAATALAPFACLDGVNEKGVSISVLTLDSEPTCHDTGKPAINTSLAIRMVLDRAATTEEAVELFRSYDMCASAGRDYHFFVNDVAGDSRVIEYDPRLPERPLVATPAREITNYYALYADEAKPYQKNGIFGHGKERALAIASILDRYAGALSERVAWEALQAASQKPNPNDITSNTQWSTVYDNTNRTAQVALRRNWDDVFEFALEPHSDTIDS